MIEARRAYLCIDWDTASRLSWVDTTSIPEREIKRPERILHELYSASAPLIEAHTRGATLVYPRVYHGWYMGKTKTEDAEAFRQLRSVQHSFGKVKFSPAQAVETLLVQNEFGVLYDTVRFRDDGTRKEQKMVDTAIAADVLHLARVSAADPQTFIFLFCEDDDLIPPTILAHQWTGRVRIIRTREPCKHMPRTSKLLIKLESRQ